MKAWAVVAYVELEKRAQVVESEDVRVLLYRGKAKALAGAKREFAKLYRSLTRERLSRHPDRDEIEDALCETLLAGQPFFLDAMDGDIIVVSMRRLEMKE